MLLFGCSTTLVVVLHCFYGLSQSIQLWSSPGALPTSIPASCRAELSKNITCSPILVSPQFAAGGRAMDPETAAQYCTPTCYNSLKSFKTNVDLRCGNTMYQMYPNPTHLQSGATVADPLAWAYNVTCVKDRAYNTGYCLMALYNGTKSKCSDCSLQYGAAMLSSDYGRDKVKPKAFSSLLSSCSVPTTNYPYTYTVTPTTSTATSTGTTTAAAKPTCTGIKYTVAAADTCQSISKAKNIAMDRLIADNQLDYNCTSLKAGTSLCLGASCALYTVTTNQTCADITRGKQFTNVQLISWNPTIHITCDNLNSMVGRAICISPPGTTAYTASQLNITTASMSSMFPGPYTTGGAVVIGTSPFNTTWYNTQTTFSAPPTKTHVFNATAATAVAARTSYCPLTDDLIADGWTIYDLPPACAALLNPYCWPDPNKPVLPSTRFPAICTPSAAPATSSAPPPTNAIPAPLEPSTVSSCKKFYKVLDGDHCYSIVNNFKITTAQFNTWNPYVGADCSKLWLGYYVCISA